MKIAGLLLLLCNFTWFTFNVMSIGPIARSVVVNHYEKLDKDTYTKKEVQKHIRDVASGFTGKLRLFFYPGLGMLIGGLLLFYSKPKKPDGIEN